MKLSCLVLSAAVAATIWTGPAAAGSHLVGSSVDVYVPNPDPQPPIAWSQGTEPPPAQIDYGGGFLQYLLTGSERPILPRSRFRSPPAPLYAPGQSQAYGPGPVASLYGTAASAGAIGAPVQASIDPLYRRQEVAYAGPHPAGTVVVDTASKFLYLVEGGGRALRYGIGVGRPGFLWAGVKVVTRKSEWPDWTPPAEMLARRPDLPLHMDGGVANPLGARALYLGSSLYRIHGTNEPNTIGTNVSSGCIRLLNEDVADLYGRVRVGTKVIVM